MQQNDRNNTNQNGRDQPSSDLIDPLPPPLLPINHRDTGDRYYGRRNPIWEDPGMERIEQMPDEYGRSHAKTIDEELMSRTQFPHHHAGPDRSNHKDRVEQEQFGPG